MPPRLYLRSFFQFHRYSTMAETPSVAAANGFLKFVNDSPTRTLYGIKNWIWNLS